MKHLYFNTPIFIDDLVNDLNVKSYDMIYIILDKCNVINKYEFIDNALMEIFGELSSLEFRSSKLRSILKKLNISVEFKDYEVSDEAFAEFRLLLQNKQPANNGLVIYR